VLRCSAARAGRPHAVELAEKCADRCADFRRMGFEREVTGVIKMNFGIRNITPESLGTGRSPIVYGSLSQTRRPGLFPPIARAFSASMESKRGSRFLI
jgi:hypothetical protein